MDFSKRQLQSDNDFHIFFVAGITKPSSGLLFLDPAVGNEVDIGGISMVEGTSIGCFGAYRRPSACAVAFRDVLVLAHLLRK